MAKIISQRMTAEIEGDFVVFIIGMKINKLWKIHKWLPVAMAMPKMIKELMANKESGLLGISNYGVPPVMVQYWRSYEQLEKYSRNRDLTHFPEWVKFNKSVGSNGDVGIWHETYKISAGNYECIYNNMPLMGLAKATKAVPATGRKASSAARMGVRSDDVTPVDPEGNVKE